jgi:anti-sigma factor RsiW
VSAERFTCRELVEIVTEYFEDALPPEDRDDFEGHIMSCPPCRAHLEQMKETIRLLGSIPQETVSPAAEETLVSALRGLKRP